MILRWLWSAAYSAGSKVSSDFRASLPHLPYAVTAARSPFDHHQPRDRKNIAQACRQIKTLTP